jgi:hypothetical protein
MVIEQLYRAADVLERVAGFYRAVGRLVHARGQCLQVPVRELNFVECVLGQIARKMPGV